MSKRTCSFPDCPRIHYANDYCKGHDRQQREGKTPTPFLSRRPSSSIDLVPWFLLGFDVPLDPDVCHEWRRGLYSKGYGKAARSMGAIYGTRTAHVLKWILANGPVPDDLLVLHHCDNPPCGNVAHLFLGTNADNSDDKIAKGRQARGEGNGRAILTGPQVLGILLRLSGGESQSSIAKRYGVSKAAISLINTGKNWRHYSL